MADDDILELTDTDIIKPGNPNMTQGTEAAPDNADKPDFGADLDAMLQADDPTKPIAAPIKNVTETNRVVNPNEEIELPPLSDLDALLEELGVQDEHEPAAEVTAESVADELDAVPLKKAGVTPGPVADPLLSESPAEPAAVAEPLPETAEPLIKVDTAEAAPTPVETAEPVSIPGGNPAVTDVIADPVKPATEVAPADGKAAASSDADIDLNELDVLLDTVLASAPKQPATVAAEQPVATGAAGLESEVSALRAEVNALRAELAQLQQDIEKTAAAAAAKVIREEIAAVISTLD